MACQLEHDQNTRLELKSSQFQNSRGDSRPETNIDKWYSSWVVFVRPLHRSIVKVRMETLLLQCIEQVDRSERDGQAIDCKELLFILLRGGDSISISDWRLWF